LTTRKTSINKSLSTTHTISFVVFAKTNVITAAHALSFQKSKDHDAKKKTA